MANLESQPQTGTFLEKAPSGPVCRPGAWRTPRGTAKEASIAEKGAPRTNVSVNPERQRKRE